MILKKDACYDKVDERDYKYSDVFDIAGGGLPAKTIDRIDDYQNQGLEEITKYMCVFYNTAHGTNILNKIEGSEVFTKGKELGLEAIDLKLLDPKFGAYIINGPKLLKKKGLIKGYTRLATIQEVKHSIMNNRPVSTGTNKIVWNYQKPYIVSGGSSYGHAFLIIGYDDDKQLLTIKNNYGKEKFDNGKNYLKYSDFGLLFNSKYSLIDSEDSILKYKKKIMAGINLEEAKKMYKLKYWNGERPTEPMSREEVMAVISRVLLKK